MKAIDRLIIELRARRNYLAHQVQGYTVRMEKGTTAHTIFEVAKQKAEVEFLDGWLERAKLFAEAEGEVEG